MEVKDTVEPNSHYEGYGGDNKLFTKKDLQISDALKRTTDQVKALVKEIHNEQTIRLGNLSEWEPQHLITFDTILKFWTINGLLRLIGMVNEAENPNPDCWAIADEAFDLLIHINREDIAKLYIQSGDSESVIIFLTIYIDRYATLREIQKRIETKEIGRRFLDWRNNRTDETVDNLINIILRKSSAWYKTKKLTKRAGRLAYTPIKEIKLTPDNEGAIETKAKAFEAVALCYHQLRDMIECGDLSPIPHSIIKGVCPVHPVWERQSPPILREMIQWTVKEYFPIVSGDLEKSPFAFINQRRNEERKGYSSSDALDLAYQVKRVMEKSLDAHDEPITGGQDKALVELWPFEGCVEYSISNAAAGLREVEVGEALNKIDALLKPNTKNRSKILRVAERALSEDLSIPDICKEEGLDKSIFYKILKQTRQTPNSRERDLRWLYFSDLYDNCHKHYHRPRGWYMNTQKGSEKTLAKNTGCLNNWNWLFEFEGRPMLVYMGRDTYVPYPRFQGIWYGNYCIFWDLKQEKMIKEYCSQNN